MRGFLRTFLILLGISALLALATTLYSYYQVKKHGFKVYYVVNGVLYDRYPLKKPIPCSKGKYDGIEILNCQTYVVNSNLFVVYNIKGKISEILKRGHNSIN